MTYKSLFPYLKPFLVYFGIYLLYILVSALEGGSGQMCGPTLSILLVLFVIPITALTFFLLNVSKYVTTKSPQKLFSCIIHGGVLAFIIAWLFIF